MGADVLQHRCRQSRSAVTLRNLRIGKMSLRFPTSVELPW
jgi:hypothetical protein